MSETYNGDAVWKAIVVELGTKKYTLKNKYSEILREFDIAYMLETRQRKLRIDNLGLIKIYDVRFETHLSTIVLKCVRA